MKLFSEVAFNETNQVLMKGNPVKEGWKIGFSSEDTQALRMMMLAMYGSTKHEDESIELNFMTPDISIFQNDPNANDLFATSPKPKGVVNIIDMTCSVPFDMKFLNKFDTWMANKDYTLIIFERIQKTLSQAFTVQMPGTMKNSANIKFVASAHPFHVISRPISLKMVECDFWPVDDLPSIMMIENYMPQMMVSGAVGEKQGE